MTDAELPPNDPAGEDAPETVTLHEGGNTKRPWVVSLYPDRLHFAAEGKPPEDVPRAAVPDRLEFVSFLFGKPALVLTLSTRKKVIFAVPADARATLREWLGPPTHEELKAILGRRLKWTVTLGAMLIVLSLPLLEGLEFDAVTCTIGGLMLGTGLLSRLMPHRIFFLIGALYFSAFLAQLLRQMFVGERSWWWLILAWFLLMIVNDWLFQFRRFAPARGEGPLGSDTGEVP